MRTTEVGVPQLWFDAKQRGELHLRRGDKATRDNTNSGSSASFVRSLLGFAFDPWRYSSIQPTRTERRAPPVHQVAKIVAVAVLLVIVGAPLVAEEPSREAADFFEMEIRPLLVGRCFECHGPASELEGHLNLASRETLLAGGDTGPAAVAGKPKESLLIEAIRYQGLKMPPKAKLSDTEIAKLERWVEMGLPWPGSNGAAPSPKSAEAEFQISAAQRQHWSFQPLAVSSPPDVRDHAWPRSDIDRFVLARLEQTGCVPNQPADKRTLVRRATFDLTGLPPTPAEVDAFLADESPEAFAHVVDRLLASPQYGQRWGRHWLDVVRYADTAGETADYPVPQAYLYRDWVISALNRDLPYDEFIRQQIAGDILAKDAPRQEYADRVTATGFVAVSRRFGFDSENYHHLTIADTLDTLGRAVLGLSIGCARCHDHKYDPVSMSDYYALYGIFASTRYAFPGSEEKKRPRDFAPLLPPAEAAPLAAAHARELEQAAAELKRIEGNLAEVAQALKAAGDPAANTATSANAAEVPAVADLKARREALQATQRQWKSKQDGLVSIGPYPVAYAVAEDTPRNATIQKRGEPTKPGPEVPRRFLEILGGDPLAADAAGSGRLELAGWLTRPSNSLTARVIVNRVWQYHFGRGLVETASDFGLRGRAPTHADLLDYLASAFVKDGWSLKQLHRQIMLSSVYQMSSEDDRPAAAQDPMNTLWWRFPRRRLEAEAIRDAMLATSGNLDRTPGGRHPFPPVTNWGFTQHTPFKGNYAEYDTPRRSVYLMAQRIQRHPFLGLFDGADANISTAERTLTTTPSQALYLMNDPFVHTQGEAFARRLLVERASDEARIDWALQLTFARAAKPQEQSEALSFLEAYRHKLIAAGVSEDRLTMMAWSAYARVLLTSNEFMHLD